MKIKKRYSAFIGFFKSMFLSKQEKAFKRWFRDHGDQTHRLDMDLDCDSIIFDVGGFHGNYSMELFEKFGCEIFIFEPVREFYLILLERFAGSDKIKVFNYGLSDRDENVEFGVSSDASSLFLSKSEKKQVIKLRNTSEVLKELNITKIDFMKINIEGGEFQLLNCLLESGDIHKVHELHIQFHSFVEGAKEKRKKIIDELKKSFKVTFSYYFVWEGWRKYK